MRLRRTVRSTNLPYRPGRPAIAELAAGAIVRLTGTDRWLLLHHVKEQRWCLPKGHVESGESIARAARRETREESGLKRIVLDRELAQVSYRFYDPRRDVNVFKTTVYWLGSSADATTHPEPLFDEARWVSLGTAHTLLPFPEEKHLLGRLGRPQVATRSVRRRTRPSRGRSKRNSQK